MCHCRNPHAGAVVVAVVYCLISRLLLHTTRRLAVAVTSESEAVGEEPQSCEELKVPFPFFSPRSFFVLVSHLVLECRYGSPRA